MRRTVICALGAAVAAGCGEKPAPVPGAADGTKTTTPAPAPKPTRVETPKTILAASAFLQDPKSHAGRVGLEGVVLEVDTKRSRFLLCDASELGCIGAG